MKKITLLLTTFVGFSFLTFSQNPGDIIIMEIMQNPSAVSDNNGEYFEIFNISSSDIDINGWTIRDDGSDSHIIDNGGPLTIASGNYLVLGRDGDTGANGGITVDYVYAAFSLANGADEVIIETPGGTIIDEVFYDGGTNFPDPTGASMEFVGSTAGENNLGSNWEASTTAIGTGGDFGTPGAINTNGPVLSNPQISVLKTQTELYPNPSLAGADVTLLTPITSEVEVSIYNSLGAFVRTQTAISSQTVSTEGLASGAYFVQLTVGKDTTTKRLIIE